MTEINTLPKQETPNHKSNTQIFGFSIFNTLVTLINKYWEQMPPPVKVFAFLVFLLLFVFMILYLVIGLACLHGVVVTLERDKDNEPFQRVASNLRIHRGTTVYTNTNGEFSFIISGFTLPGSGLEFLFGESDNSEIVTLPSPYPFVSLFQPNDIKLWYVPGSKIKDSVGTYKRYFLDPEKAGEAFGERSAVTQTNSKLSRTPITSLNSIIAPDKAFADLHNYVIPTYTLRIKSIYLRKSKGSEEVYFDVKVNGQTIYPEDIPRDGSPKFKYITLFPGTTMNFEDLDIPITKLPSQIKIGLFADRLFKDEKVGHIEFEIGEKGVGNITKVGGQNIDIEYQVFPPLFIGYISLPGNKTGDLNVINVWLDTSPKWLNLIDKVYFDLGPGLEQQNLGSEHLEQDNFFQFTITIREPRTITSKITFLGGGSLRLRRDLIPKAEKPDSAAAHFALADAYYFTDELEKASEHNDKALSLYPNFVSAIDLKGAIQAESGEIENAIRLYEEALKLYPNNTTLLNGYSWLIATMHPKPTGDLIRKAMVMCERAIAIQEKPKFYDTLGVLNFKINNNSEALVHLSRAKTMQEKFGIDDFGWIHINSHLGHLYLKDRKPKLAREAFWEIMRWSETYAGHAITNKRLQNKIEDAKLQLEKLN